MKHINLTQMLQGCSKRNGMTVSASGSDGAQTCEVKRQTLSSKNEKWSENGALSSTCLRSASVPLSFRSRLDSLSLVSRQSDLEQVRAVSVGLSARVWKYVAMIFAVLTLACGNAKAWYVKAYGPGWGGWDSRNIETGEYTWYNVSAGTFYYHLGSTESKWSGDDLVQNKSTMADHPSIKSSAMGLTDGQMTITLPENSNVTIKYAGSGSDWKVNVYVRPAYYIKYNWGGTGDGSGWNWSDHLYSNGDGTYSTGGKYRSSSAGSYDYNYKANDDGKTNSTNITKLGSPSNGEECIFTYKPSDHSLTIQKKNTTTGTNHIYFDNTEAGWSDSKIQFVMGHLSWSRTFEMSKVGSSDQTNLYYVARSDNNWTDAAYFGMIGSGSKFVDGAWGSRNMMDATHYSAPLYKSLNLRNNYNYLVSKADNTDGNPITVEEKGNSKDNLNSTQTYNYAISTNGVDYTTVTSGKTPAQILVTSYKFNSRTDITNSNCTIAVNNTTRTKDLTVAYTGKTTITVSNVWTGYSFVGWYVGSSLLNASPSFVDRPTSAKTVTARIKANQYKVEFNKNGGSGSMSDQTFTYDIAQNLTTCSFTAPSGKVFMGWSTSSSGDVVYTDGQSVSNLSSEDGATVKLYAIWAYLLTYNCDGADICPENTAGSALPNPLPTPVKYGYNFDGWFTNSGKTTPAVAGAAIAANTTLYAKWTKVYATTMNFAESETRGTDPNDQTLCTKSVDNKYCDHDAFRVDNYFFSATKLQYETGNASDKYNGWKCQYNGATIKFYVENDCTVAVAMGANAGCSIKYTPIDGSETTENLSTEDNTTTTKDVKGGTMVTLTTTSGSTVTLKSITITDKASCTTPTIAWSASPADGNVGGNRTISVTSNYPAGVTISSNNSNATLTNRTVDGSTVSYQLNYAVAGGANITASVTGAGDYCAETVALSPVAITVSKNTPTSYTASGGTFCSGAGVVTLSGSQSGISYQLYNGASTVGDAKEGTGSALTWTSLSTAAGYTVKTVADDTYSEATMSGTATVAFYDAVSIGTQPTTPVAATVGSACSITGLVAAGTSPTYQWQTCNSDGSSATNITAAGAMSFTNWTTATLGLTPTAAGATYYKCVVRGSCGDPVTSNVVTVNASAAPTLYTITYNANGGTCKASDTQASEGAAITLATPTTPNDSTFKGWYINGELVTAATYRPTSDVTAYALWHKNCAGGGGGGGSEESGTVTFYCSSSPLTTSTITNDNDDVTFTYSDLSANGSSASICNVSSQYGIKGKNAKLITVTCPSGYYFKSAQFHLASFGNKETPTAQILSGSTALYSCSAHKYTKFDDADCGDIFSCEDSISGFVASKYTTLTVKETGGDKNLGVLLLDYTIAPTGGGGGSTCWHVKYLGGTGVDGGYVVDAAAYANNASATAKANSNPGFTREGYTFNGWQDGAGNSFTAGGSITMTKDTTLIAQWTEDVAPAEAPVITDQPDLSEVALGETASFSLTATGATSYQWYNCDSEGENKTEVSGATEDNYSYTTTVTGTTYYICKVSNANGDTWSDVVGSIVNPATFTVKYTAGADDGKTYDLAGGANDFTQGHEAVSEVADKFSNWSNYTFTGVGISSTGKKGTMSMLISMPTAYDADKYVSFHFDLAANYQLQLTNVNLQVQAKDNDGQSFKFVISDEYGHSYTKEVASLGQTGKLVQIGGDISETTKFVGTITLKLYGWYSSTDYYRLAKEVTITGEVSSLPAPTASWTARPASATVGDGGKTYTLTTDGTNAVAWSITDQSGATDAALSPTSGLTTTLDDYSTAGSLYVQAAVTGDGIHYLSTPATLLRQRVVISAGCVETTLISATLSSCTGTGAVSGTPGGSSAVEFESCESIDGGYKMGKDESYARLTLASGNFEANDEVKITITKASDQGDGALHIYKYADASWTELGSVTAAGAGTYSYTLTETNVSTAFNTIGLYRTEKNQNPYVKALSVVRNSCSASKPSSVTVTASPTGPSYDIDADLTLTVSADNANTYQWYSNSNNTASDGFLLVGETAITYSPSTAIAGTTYYYCVATNTSGSTVSNIIEVTVNSSKTAPTVSWTDTYETPTYGGGGYAVKATVSDASWDGTLTTDMLTASDGVTLTGVSVSGKVITATYGVTETARSPLSFSLTLPETTNYTALAANKEITFTRCGEGAAIETTEHPLPVKSSYTTASNPTYRWETDGVGWLTLVTGSSTLSSTSDSYSGFSYRSSSGKSSITFYSELDAVSAVRIYIKGGGPTTLSKVQKGTTLGKYTKLTPSTDYDYSYSNGSSSIESREQAYIEITFKTALSANTFVEITLSRNTEYYGVGLITGNSEVGNITTALSWATDPGTTVNKKTTDANFRYEAVKASDAASQATLGTISYKSSVPAVATVSATGVVDILSAGSTRITATLAGSGCYKKATKSYNLVVAEATCTDEAGTITASGSGITIDGNTVTKADACAAVTLTVSGHTGEDDGAIYQWYKDGVSMGESYQEKSITVTDNGDYTVEVTNTGDGHCTMPATNTITITGNAISITNIVDEWYVKNGRRTPDIALATIEGTTSYTVNDGISDITTFAGCGFELRDGILYLKGQQENGDEPNGLTAGNATLTITAVNACGDDPTATITIHKQVETAKPSIAFIVDGTKGDPVNNVATAKTSSRPIWIYLSESFDLTGCNAYWTNNEKLIRQYYSQFDAIVITDDPSTDEKPSSGLKYVNALGTMVDVRPVLTMEAYVGKYGASSNWHIGGTPSSPNPRQYELKLQCKDHDIFFDLTPSANFRSEEIDGETYYYVTMVDNSVTPYAGLADDAETGTYPALQGFSAASIKGTGLLGIGTISDGTLQGGVERQDEPTARMMILGIQHQAMAALTSEGKQVIKNAINYLLKTDMEEVDDCSNYFIGGTLGHEQDWHTASNWSSTKVPDASTKARILVPVTISTKVHVAQVDIAVDGRSIRYNSGNTNCSGSVTIAPTGALIVDGQVRRTTNGRLYTEEELQPTTPANLTIQTNSSAQGALIFDNSDGETQATVVVRSKANKDEGTRNWQYLTSPLQETPVTEFFYGVGTYTYRHCEADGGWVRYGLGTTFHAFDAIGLTQEDAKDFVFYGPLAPTGEWNLSLTHARSGNNLFGNSWTAPIDLKALVRNTDIDDSKIELDLAIYNTGTDQKNESGEFVQEDNADNTPGTWHHIPLRLATLDGAGWKGMTVIPAYQAFQLKATAAATLTIDYDKCVRGSESKNYTEPLRSPGHRAAGKSNSDIEALRLAVSDAKGIAYIYLLEGEQFSEEYDNGWELEYKPNSKYGKLYAISPAQGDMMALARPSLEGTMIGFQPGESSEYTITFNETDGYYYLNDLKMEQSTLIQAGESYTFSVEEGESANRFLISSVPFNKPGIVTGVTNPDAEAPKVQKVIYNDKLYIIRGGKVFSADGQLVK